MALMTYDLKRKKWLALHGAGRIVASSLHVNEGHGTVRRAHHLPLPIQRQTTCPSLDSALGDVLGVTRLTPSGGGLFVKVRRASGT